MDEQVRIIPQEETARRFDVALLGSESGERFSLRVSRPLPNEGTPLHEHLEQSETFHVVEGEFLFQVGDRPIASQSGATIHIPKQTPHCFLNIGDCRGYLISILSPGIHDGFIEQIPRAQREGTDPQTLTEMAARYGTRILGPKLKPE